MMKTLGCVLTASLGALIVGVCSSAHACYYDTSTKLCHSAKPPYEVEMGGFIWHVSETAGYVPTCVDGSTWTYIEDYEATCAWTEHWYLNPWTYHDDPKTAPSSSKNCFGGCDPY